MSPPRLLTPRPSILHDFTLLRPSVDQLGEQTPLVVSEGQGYAARDRRPHHNPGRANDQSGVGVGNEL
jgi:hypothetical protein